MADCPCKQTLTEGEKGILNFGLNNEMLRNPNAAAIAVTRQLLGANSSRVLALMQATTPGSALGQLFPSFSRLQNNLRALENVVGAFENECNRLTNPQELLRTISNLSLFGELNCALGIPGLDVGVGLSVVNERGQLSINYAVAANVDLERVLNKFSDGAGTNLANAVRDLQEGLNGVFSGIDQANGALNSVLDEAAAIQNLAADFIQKYTTINALANLINLADQDSCFKLGTSMNASVFTPEFLSVVRGGTRTGFGGGGFR